MSENVEKLAHGAYALCGFRSPSRLNILCFLFLPGQFLLVVKINSDILVTQLQIASSLDGLIIPSERKSTKLKRKLPYLIDFQFQFAPSNSHFSYFHCTLMAGPTAHADAFGFWPWLVRYWIIYVSINIVQGKHWHKVYIHIYIHFGFPSYWRLVPNWNKNKPTASDNKNEDDVNVNETKATEQKSNQEVKQAQNITYTYRWPTWDRETVRMGWRNHGTN